MPNAKQIVTDSSPLSPAEIRSIVAGVVLAVFLGALDQTIVATAMPTIARELSDFNNVSWIASIYLLSATTVTPLYGKFSDMHGRRIALLLGIITFVLGSIACAIAPSMLFLIAARALQGLGGGGLISLAQTIIADIIAPKDRGRYQVYFTGVFLAASVLGPTLGGLFTEHLHWSFIFWINLPLGVLAFWMTNFALKRLPRHDRPHKLDIFGSLLLVIATISLMLVLSAGGVRYGWLSVQIICLAAVSALFWILFAKRIATAPEPLIPIELLSKPVVMLGTLSACFGMGTYIGLTIYMPVYFETVRGLSSSSSGLALTPLMIGTVIGATLAGQTMGRFQRYKRLPIAGLLMAVAGTLILAIWGSVLDLLIVELTLGAISLGFGTLLPTTTVAIQNVVQLHQLGTATGVMNFFRQLGSAVFVAIFGAILLNSGIQENAHMEGGQTSAYAFLFIFVAAFMGFACALIFFVLMKEEPLRAHPGHVADQAVAE